MGDNFNYVSWDDLNVWTYPTYTTSYRSYIDSSNLNTYTVTTNDHDPIYIGNGIWDQIYISTSKKDISSKNTPLKEVYGDNSNIQNYITFDTIIKFDDNFQMFEDKTVRECLKLYGKTFIDTLVSKNLRFANNDKMNTNIEKRLKAILDSFDYWPKSRRKSKLSIF